jgi:DNA-directed RNA polymerase sigma subunit (sigma70/sigma32)
MNKNDSIPQKAMALFQELRPRILALARKLESFGLSREDCLQEAFLAIMKALSSYRANTNMKLSTFCYYFVEKALYRMAGEEEIMYVVIDDDGNIIEELENGEYRRKKTKLKKRGYRVESRRKITPISDLTLNTEDGGIENFIERRVSWEKTQSNSD